MKIDEVHKELSSLQEQLDEEKASIKDKEGDLQSKIVSYHLCYYNCQQTKGCP